MALVAPKKYAHVGPKFERERLPGSARCHLFDEIDISFEAIRTEVGPDFLSLRHKCLNRVNEIIHAREDVRRGDLIQLDWDSYRNSGTYIFDGIRVVELTDPSGEGVIPPTFLVPTEFPPGYWRDYIQCSNHMPLNVKRFREELLVNLAYGCPPNMRLLGELAALVHTYFTYEGEMYVVAVGLFVRLSDVVVTELFEAFREDIVNHDVLYIQGPMNIRLDYASVADKTSVMYYWPGYMSIPIIEHVDNHDMAASDVDDTDEEN